MPHYRTKANIGFLEGSLRLPANHNAITRGLVKAGQGGRFEIVEQVDFKLGEEFDYEGPIKPAMRRYLELIP